MMGVMGAAAIGTAATGEGIIEGTESEGVMDSAGAENKTEGELVRAPTDWNGKEIWLGLTGRTAFVWANVDVGNANATATATIRFIRPFYRMISTLIWDLGVPGA
jgi:hypothetical protein